MSTVVEVLTRLAAAVASIQTTLAEMNTMAGMTPEQAAQLSQAVDDIASIKATVNAMSVTDESLQSQISATAAQLLATAGAVAAATEAVSALRTDVDAVRADVQTLKGGIGDLGGLPQI